MAARSGKPQRVQVSAYSETSCLHSGHLSSIESPGNERSADAGPPTLPNHGDRRQYLADAPVLGAQHKYRSSDYKSREAQGGCLRKPVIDSRVNSTCHRSGRRDMQRLFLDKSDSSAIIRLLLVSLLDNTFPASHFSYSCWRMRLGVQKVVNMLLKKVKLSHFFGFTSFEVELSPFTCLVGPNNGGKTNLLRAVRFVTDAFRMHFGGGDEPNMHALSSNMRLDLQTAAERLGLQDYSYLYYGKSRTNPAEAVLTFFGPSGDCSIHASCIVEADQLVLSCECNGRPIDHKDRPFASKAVQELYEASAHFLPPLGTMTPTEKVLTWPELHALLRQGRHAETWRNQLHWFNEGQPPERFQRIIALVRTYFGSHIELHPPRRTDQQAANVVMDYSESAKRYDIAAAGGGFRTIVSLIAAIELSGARILLLDEPDSHLHSTLQREITQLLLDRANEGRQIIISTHAPDVIDEVPVESLRWIDRSKDSAAATDDTGKVLVQLGATSNTHAIQAIGSDVVIYYEGKPDRKAFGDLMKRCDREALFRRSRSALLKGVGNVEHVPSAIRLMKSLLPMQVAVVVFRDSDYSQDEPRTVVESLDEILVIRLAVKELENLLLLDARTIYSAAKAVSDARANQTGEPARCPSLEEVDTKISECSLAAEVRDATEHQYMFRWLQLRGGLNDASQLQEAKTEFETRWRQSEWRRRCCPGKRVLISLRRWLQSDPWKLSLSMPIFFRAYTPDADILNVFGQMEDYVEEITGKKS